MFCFDKYLQRGCVNEQKQALVCSVLYAPQPLHALLCLQPGCACLFDVQRPARMRLNSLARPCSASVAPAQSTQSTAPGRCHGVLLERLHQCASGMDCTKRLCAAVPQPDESRSHVAPVRLQGCWQPLEAPCLQMPLGQTPGLPDPAARHPLLPPQAASSAARRGPPKRGRRKTGARALDWQR